MWVALTFVASLGHLLFKNTDFKYSFLPLISKDSHFLLFFLGETKGVCEVHISCSQSSTPGVDSGQQPQLSTSKALCLGDKAQAPGFLGPLLQPSLGKAW